MIYQICDVMTSISTRDRLHFSKYLLNHNSLGHWTWSIDRFKQGNNFKDYFEKIGGLEISSRSFSIEQPTLITQ